MRFLIQRVKSASVDVDGNTIGKIDKGYLVLVGMGQGDNKEIADKMIKKLFTLRICEDSDGKTNLSLLDTEGQLLIVSQFTLYANCRKGNRPSFTDALEPAAANELYEYVIEKCKETVSVVEHGSFGADMAVSLLNDGPFTVMLDSEVIF